jgi:circadian clock protein KaiB
MARERAPAAALRRMVSPVTTKTGKPRKRRSPLCLRLYVAGTAPNSLRAVANVTAICEQHFASGHELEIVDILAHPARAMADGVIVTPTLIKLRPLPLQRIIGNLSDTSQVILVLSGT